MTVWTPDDGHHRPLGEATPLTKAERLWLGRRATGETGKPPPSLTGRVRRSCQRLKDQATVVGNELHAATVTNPPPRPGTVGRRGSDPSDPALAAITSTHEAIDRGMWRFGHLLDDCPDCPIEGHNVGMDTLATLLDDDWTETAKWLSRGIVRKPSTVYGWTEDEPSPRAAISRAVFTFDGGADRLADWWRQLRADGAEPEVLANLADRFERLASRMTSLAGSMGQWSAGSTRLCECEPGCRAPANHGRMNDAHRKRIDRAS